MSAPTKTHPVPQQASAPLSSPDTADRVPQITSENFQAITRALADPRRFAILKQIAANENLLCGHLDVQGCISPATISHHLRELQEAGLVDARRDGRSMCLTLRRSVWNSYLRQLQQI